MIGYKSTKIKNIIAKNFPGLTCLLKNHKATPYQTTWGEKPGCSGFITDGNKTCYLSTEQTCASWIKGALIRECRDTKDYTGKRNEFVETEADFVNWLKVFFAA